MSFSCMNYFLHPSCMRTQRIARTRYIHSFLQRCLRWIDGSKIRYVPNSLYLVVAYHCIFSLPAVVSARDSLSYAASSASHPPCDSSMQSGRTHLVYLLILIASRFFVQDILRSVKEDEAHILLCIHPTTPLMPHWARMFRPSRI